MLSLLYFSLVRVLDGWLCGINQEAACLDLFQP